MTTVVKIELNKHTSAAISEVLRNNLFTLGEDSWVYTDDDGQLAMSITYAIEENEIVFEVWMIDEEMQILLDKVMDEIKEER